MDLSGIAWLAVFPLLALLILVHEFGHFFMATKLGIKVLEFGIGIPPRAKVLFVRNGVKFTLNWLPIGGFVRMVGEDGNFDAPGSLAAAPPWKKIPVLAAGVIMNFLTAIVLTPPLLVERTANPRAARIPLIPLFSPSLFYYDSLGRQVKIR